MSAQVALIPCSVEAVILVWIVYLVISWGPGLASCMHMPRTTSQRIARDGPGIALGEKAAFKTNCRYDVDIDRVFEVFSLLCVVLSVEIDNILSFTPYNFCLLRQFTS